MKERFKNLAGEDRVGFTNNHRGLRGSTGETTKENKKCSGKFANKPHCRTKVDHESLFCKHSIVVWLHDDYAAVTNHLFLALLLVEVEADK